MQARLTIIVAMDRARGIGVDNKLPWHLPEDLAHFKRLTTGHPIVMGRKTYDSIGRPLPNRRNVVITRNPAWKAEGVDAVGSVEEALRLLDGTPAFLIGGAQIFEQARDLADRMIVTEIDKTFDCDTFFPPIDGTRWQEVARESHYSEGNGCAYAFVTYERRPDGVQN
ncbi:dihydrofolate reductase [Noviherbaspirillum aridicola]|uniref:Dihydrofolate reductase n=1 Tax=Noviherbaspirillum aridicola TaxID=2849687 RepID=A0ABQ4QAB7_9BURK|nr:dihydrofolate reductase [Noviherbaspirillum aridicola]GIZ53614.1 dihydrofolate reductase [Noviherbaspirillum aridicola]